MKTETELLNLRKIAFIKRKRPLLIALERTSMLQDLLAKHVKRPFVDSHDVRDIMAALEESLTDLLIHDLRFTTLNDVLNKKEK
jgi:hypothetical protein